MYIGLGPTGVTTTPLSAALISGQQQIPDGAALVVWLESNEQQWPEWAESILKQLITFHELNAEQIKHHESSKVDDIGRDFYTYINPRDWTPTHHQIFSARLRTKISRLRVAEFDNQQMQRNNDTTSMQQHTIVSTKAAGLMEAENQHTSASLPMKTRPHQPPPSTSNNLPQPHTFTNDVRKIKMSGYEVMAKLWRDASAEAQIELFRSQLQSAKDPKALMQEMASFCGEIYTRSRLSSEGIETTSPNKPANGSPLPSSEEVVFCDAKPSFASLERIRSTPPRETEAREARPSSGPPLSDHPVNIASLKKAPHFDKCPTNTFHNPTPESGPRLFAGLSSIAEPKGPSGNVKTLDEMIEECIRNRDRKRQRESEALSCYKRPKVYCET